MFWGLNMGMLTGEAKKTTKAQKVEKTAVDKEVASEKGKVSKLKAWVKNAVNCCIE
jgi:hypothetical protein